MSALKLLYIYIGGSNKVTSVQKKVRAQLQGLNEAGIKSEGVFYNEKNHKEEMIDGQIHLVGLPEYKTLRRFFQSYHKLQFHLAYIHKDLEKRAKGYDLIFLRHGGNGPAYERLLDLIAEKTFLYVPSNRIRETYCERYFTKDHSLASAFFGWWEYFNFWRREKKLMKQYFSKLRGIVTFTPEFGRILQKDSKEPLHLIYNRDGVSTDEVKHRSCVLREGEEIQLIFLKGSATEQKWAGLDRLIRSIEAFPALRFRLYITGNADKQKERYERPFVTLTGRLSDENLEKLIDEVDLGVSNLENYLIHFEETTNLKSRDYYSRGLPFIQSNTMPDIEGTAGKRFYHYIPNDDSIIDMKAVHDFAMEMRNDPEHPRLMHGFALEKLDWRLTTAELAKEILA